MPGFNGLARFVGFCGEKFYGRFPWLLRKKQAKGHGVHSPFAFNLITNVIYSPHHFYAFYDIYDRLSLSNINPEDSITGFNHLSFRLVHHLQPPNILEINPGAGINTLFLTAPSPHIRCKQMREGESIKERYDAIFVNLEEDFIPDRQTLMELSHSNTFWVIHSIKRGKGKQFWNEIVHDMRIRVTFDVRDTGIVFLRQDLAKANYLV